MLRGDGKGYQTKKRALTPLEAAKFLRSWYPLPRSKTFFIFYVRSVPFFLSFRGLSLSLAPSNVSKTRNIANKRDFKNVL